MNHHWHVVVDLTFGKESKVTNGTSLVGVTVSTTGLASVIPPGIVINTEHEGLHHAASASVVRVATASSVSLKT